MHNGILPEGDVKMRLVLEIEDESGTKKTIEIHQFEMGPGIYYVNQHGVPTRPTGMSWTETHEMTRDDSDVIKERLIPTNRIFLDMHLVGLLSPAQHSEHKEGMRFVDHSKVEDGVDPESLLLGRKPE